MAHSKPYVRKKAVLAMYKLFVAYPQGLRLTFDKLRDKLNDAEATVTKDVVLKKWLQWLCYFELVFAMCILPKTVHYL